MIGSAPAIVPFQRTGNISTREPRLPIRVSFVIDRLSRAGTESQLLALIRHASRSRIEPTLVLLDGTDEESLSLEPEDCPVLRLGTKKLLSRSGFAAARHLRTFWQRTRPDVVQAYFLDSSYLALPLAKLLGIRTTIRVQNNLGYWITPRHRLLNRVLRRLSDQTLTNSESGRVAICQSERVARNRVVAIENGVDLERFAGFAPPCGNPNAVRIGCVANLRPVKNIDGLLHAARIVCDRDPRVEFAIAGDGEQRAELERLRTALDLEKRVEFRGSIADVPGFLSTLDIAVVPSHSEGMSNALLEAMAAGRAVVATDVGANARLLADGTCGLLVPPGNPEMLATAIARLVVDPALARQLGAKAHSRVADGFSREAMCRRFEEFYLAVSTLSLVQCRT